MADGITWLEDGATLSVTSDLGFHSAVVDQSSHPTLRPGEMSQPLMVRIRNTGARPWTRGIVGQQVNLGVAGDDRTMSALGVGWPSADRVAIQGEPLVGPGVEVLLSRSGCGSEGWSPPAPPSRSPSARGPVR